MDTVLNKKFKKCTDMYKWCLIVNACARAFLNIFVIGFYIFLTGFFTLPVIAICTLCGTVMTGDKELWERRIDDCRRAFRDANIDGITINNQRI